MFFYIIFRHFSECFVTSLHLNATFCQFSANVSRRMTRKLCSGVLARLSGPKTVRRPNGCGAVQGVNQKMCMAHAYCLALHLIVLYDLHTWLPRMRMSGSGKVGRRFDTPNLSSSSFCMLTSTTPTTTSLMASISPRVIEYEPMTSSKTMAL